MKKLILIFGLLSSSLSFGADWVVFATSGKSGANYTEHSYDKSSLIKINNNAFQVWWRAYEVENKFRADMKEIIYCNDHTIGLKEVFYYSDDNFLNNIKYADRIESPPPDSVGSVLVKKLCKKAP